MLAEDLTQFTGTEHHFLDPLSRMKYTDGVKYFADTAGAYWFLHIVFSEYLSLMREEGFLSINLTINYFRADITVTDGNNNELIKKRHIEHRDWQRCPDGEYKFFFYNDVLLLQSEY